MCCDCADCAVTVLCPVIDCAVTQASDFTVVANRIPEPGVAGTSCASPTASGVIAYALA